MTSIVNALYEVRFNPFKYGEYLASFYSILNETEENLLLAPLVIPICSHPLFSTKLAKANIRSSIWSIFQERSQLYDLQERVDEFQILTEQSLQYCIVNDWIFFEEDRLMLHCKTVNDSKLSIQKSAYNLGRLFQGHTVSEIYAFLGVKPR
ncbi:DUF6521 family protein [Vibrio sp. Of14-4]|uniref:three component ABC system middle component n=1 Tax=Vibrio sp. Of14-4 TaxID=2724878 RepID=UPI001EF319FB|nr:three component ABC system middle component [Vibrio sp. Of14-4]MCG7489279.1 DUF6521 family protein [Vibrio sp. Of14-4]